MIQSVVRVLNSQNFSNRWQLLAAEPMSVNLAEFEADVGKTKGPIGPFAFTE